MSAKKNAKKATQPARATKPSRKRVKPIPDGFHSVTPYLVIRGVPKLIDFLKHAFGAKDMGRHERPDKSVMHAQVRIGDSMVMMGEPQGDVAPKPAMLYLYVEDTDATYRRAIEAGGTSLMEPADQFYGDRNAGVKDSFGNQWWIATHKEDVSHAEMLKRMSAARR
ncbi:VOC family protein [bacterium]|nr:VOC family protein [bacterium]